MTNAAVYLAAVLASSWPDGPQERPRAQSASGDDGRVRVTVSVDRGTVAPGEDARVLAASTVLVDGPLRFPQGHHQPLAFLYLRTPAGRLIVHPQNGVSPRSCRALEPNDYARPSLFKKGAGGPVIAYDIPLVNPSPGWLDPETYEPVRPDLRREGVYVCWARYTVPRVNGVPEDAWHGPLETGRVRFTVREVPVARRRDEATAEQIAHLEAYMKSMAASAAGKAEEPPAPKAVEVPPWLSLEQRVQWALARTENEGLARHAVALLAEHQPKDRDRPYPPWWNNVSFFVQQSRAYCRGHDANTLRIIGPYLEEYARVAVTELEYALARPAQDPQSLGAGYYLDLLLDYVGHEPKSPVRSRLEALARGYARVPADARPGDRKTRERLVTSWKILLALGVLRDGMPFTGARAILGEPTWRQGDAARWNYGTGSRLSEPGVNGRVVAGAPETIVFIRHPDRGD